MEIKKILSKLIYVQIVFILNKSQKNKIAY